MYNRIVLALLAWANLSTTAQDTTPQLDARRLGERSFSGAQALVSCDDALIVVTTENAYVTVDDGRSWKDVASPLTHKSVVDILYDNDTLYVLTNNGVISRSSNQGLWWTQTSRYQPGTVNRLQCTPSGPEAKYRVEAEKYTSHVTGTYLLS